MVLSTITARRVQEDNLLLALARLLVEDLALAPHGRLDVNVSADDTILVRLGLIGFGRWASVGIVQKFEDAAPDVRPAGEGVLCTYLCKDSRLFAVEEDVD